MRNRLRSSTFVVLAAAAALGTGCGSNTHYGASYIVDLSFGAVLDDAGNVIPGDEPDFAVPSTDDGGCGLRTCAGENANCGPIGDGCGGMIDCGQCTAPERCGGGGMPSRCGGHMGC